MAPTPPPTREPVAATGSSVSPSLFIPAALLILAVVVVRRLPSGLLPRKLAELADRLAELRLYLLFAGALLTAVLVLLAMRDYRRSLADGYVPASPRVRAAQAVAIALGVLAAGVLFLLSARPSLLLLLVTPTAIALLLPWAGLAVGYELACLRPVVRVFAPLPPFPAAAEAFRDTNDFILGATGIQDWKRPVDPLRWFLIPEKAMYTNIFAMGGIGSGKTGYVLKPLLDQALFKYSKSPASKIGLFVIDGTKGSLTEHVYARAKLAGRAGDVIEITPGGNWSWNPIAEGNPTAQASKLVAALEVMTAQESNTYYKKMQREFAENAFQILADVLGVGRFTLRDLYDFVCDAKVQAKFLDAAKPKNSISYRWFLNQWAKEDPHEQIQLTKGFRADLSLFVRDELAPTFCTANATFPGWRAFLDSGKIVIFNMDLSQWGSITRALGIFFLMDFQRSMIARSQPSFRAAGGNVERLILACIDECWAFMNPALAEFTSVSRESKCCTIGLTQSLGQFPPHYRDTMIANFRTAILLPVQDPLTLTTYSQLFGTHRTTRQSSSESVGFSGVELRLLTDVLRARDGGESRSVSTSMQEVEEPRFSLTDLLHLEENTAAVLMFNGRVIERSRAVRLMPSYRPEFQLWPEPEGEGSR